MDCPHCSTPHSDAARFCARCGTPLQPHIDRSRHFAVHPDEPVRALAVMSTLMPHLSGTRHHIYRVAIALALLSALTFAAFGVLSIALVLAAIALPTVVLTYIHDHDAWREEPITVIGVAFLLSLVLGVGVGLIEHNFTKPVLLSVPNHRLPPLTQILELGVLIPVAGFVAVLIAPILTTARRAFRHPVDAMVACSLSGAALSLGISVVVQRGAFTHIGATAGDPAHVAFIALTLGFLQPIIFATAAAMVVVPLRGAAINTTLGLAKGLALVVLYELATTLLTPYGARGIVLTTLAAMVLAVAGLIATRNTLHTALLAEAQATLSGDHDLIRAPDTHQICAHCGAAIGAGAAFCQVCGTTTAALARHPSPPTGAPPTPQKSPQAKEAAMSSTPPPSHIPPPHYPGSAGRVGHRLRPVVIAVIAAVVILIAAAVTATIVLTGPANRPEPPPMLPGSHATMAAPAESDISQPPKAPSKLEPTPRTARAGEVKLTSAEPINIGHGVWITPAPGWTLVDQGPNRVMLHNADSSAQMYVAAKPAGATDVVAVLQADINQLFHGSSYGLIDSALLGEPKTKTLQSTNFQQYAAIDFIATVLTQQGSTGVVGAFGELLNTSNQLSVFIDFRQTGDGSDHAVADGRIMLDSML
ncbi:Double zinc ribbon [Mycobacterium marinum]|uniref:zinc ribbon domain-containing protein n=1 Tax=Mycobacterium marinum TaxID=1781 RepID=UPI000E3C7EA8|nr:zinc ribbon domain-containing protein [Mycobacterium marinum]RFZ21382.1 Double zinc ribbon [Mycobacterium marinum]